MLQLIESKSWEIDVPGSSLLIPKILGDKHKPIFKIRLILSIHYRECDMRYSQMRKEISFLLKEEGKEEEQTQVEPLHTTQLYTKTIILSKQHSGSGTVHLEDLTMSNGHIN